MNEAGQELNLSTADHPNVGFHPWLNIQSARWLRFGSAPTLWTFKGLDAARHLYERHGFRLAEEYAGAQWGVNLVEQRFEREGGRSANYCD